MLFLTNLSNKTLKFDDLGNTLIYGIDGIMAQNVELRPNETISLVETNNVKNSWLIGDIFKFVQANLLSVVGNCYSLRSLVIPGDTAGQALGLLDVIDVVSILAFDSVTGVYGVKALLESGGYTSDYYVLGNDIVLETDQSLNNLLVTYFTI